MRLLRAVLKESGASVSSKEVEAPGWRKADGTRARLDISYLAKGGRHYVDVTIRHPRARKYVAQAAHQDGAAVLIA